ncbi:MAG: RagB/SusD family nutrient uptake outer membrane protein [Bacteroidota bacterium]
MRKYILFILILCLFSSSCEDLLEEETFGELREDEVDRLIEEAGVVGVGFSFLASGYASNRLLDRAFAAYIHAPSLMTGEVDGSGGTWEFSVSNPFEEYSWDLDQFMINQVYNRQYAAISNCNRVTDLITVTSDSLSTTILGQAHALRGYSYWMLYDYFGRLIISESRPNANIIDQSRATLEETQAQIESDLRIGADLIPEASSRLGVMSKGGALGILTRFYLNEKRWADAANTALEVMDLGAFSLDNDFGSIFKQTSEGSQEILWGIPYQVNNANEATILGALTLPPGILLQGGQGNLPAHLRVPADFVESFADGDVRQNEYPREYPNGSGGTSTLPDGFHACLKYGQDPGANGAAGGIDHIVVRYADILLMRAEALNELNGPNQESIDLINQVRTRSNAPELSLSNFSSTEQLRDAILQERAWEFHFEGLRRRDLIRHGKLVSDALARGKANAEDFRLLFPLPSAEIDNNPSVNENNPGY